MNTEGARNTRSVSSYITRQCQRICALHKGGWSGGAMVLGKLPVAGRPTILI